jgi:hypothetical protein
MLENFEIMGEEAIRDFFEVEGIRYKQEIEIPNLKGDTKKWRRADFYLPEYEVYFEYVGRWNEKKAQKEYKEKMKLFEQNRLPCIYVYPNELATLRQTFYMKLQQNLVRRRKNCKAFMNILKMNRFNYGFVFLSFAIIAFFAIRTQSAVELAALIVALLSTSLYLILELYPAIKRYTNIKKVNRQ